MPQKDKPSLLDAVALLGDRPDANLTRGQVGTVLDDLGTDMVVVEFSDEMGRPYAVTPCTHAELIVLRYDVAA